MHFHAFGEPYVNGVREAGYPCDREFVAEINEVAQRCLAEAGSDPTHSALAELLNKPGLWKADAVAPLLFKCKPAWPPSGRRLYDLFAQYDRAQADEVVKLEAATDQVEACLMSEQVVFEGVRDGWRERIDPARIYGVTVVWQNGTVSAHPMIPQPGARLLVWQEVVIERASLARWLYDMEVNAHGQAAPARAAVEARSGPPPYAKMTTGRAPFEREWRIIKPLAIAIYKENGPYDRSVGFTQKLHAEMILEEFGNLQNSEPEKCGSLHFPSPEWVKKKLREIRGELEEIIFEYD